MNILDICIITMIVLSGLFAFARGFVKECLSIASWIGATGVALYAMPYLRPLVRPHVPAGAVDPVAAGAAFIVTLVVLTIVTGTIARFVRRSSLSALDRTLGLIFGLGRGALLVAIGFLALSFVLPASGARPDWLAQSRTAPLFAAATTALTSLMPATIRQRAAQLNPQQQVQTEFESALRAYTLPKTAGAQSNAGPTPEEQKRLNELFLRYGGDVLKDPPEHVIEVGPATGQAGR
jgi:membrane protein required for colicin V production